MTETTTIPGDQPGSPRYAERHRIYTYEQFPGVVRTDVGFAPLLPADRVQVTEAPGAVPEAEA